MKAKMSDIIVKYSVECPNCKIDTKIEYDEIVDRHFICEGCWDVFFTGERL